MENKIFYNYRSWNSLHDVRAIFENQIYLSKPSDFNDPYDCNISLDFDSMRDGDWSEVIRVWKERDYFSQGPIVVGSDIYEIVEEELKNGGVEKFKKDHLLDSKQVVNNAFGILCLCPEWRNLKLWSHYAQKHTGICIGYDVDRLKKFVPNCIFEKVNYAEHYPKIKYVDALKDNFKHFGVLSIITKSTHWQDEGEYRIICSSMDRPDLNRGIISKNRTVNLPEGIISEVILGMRVAENDQILIKKICSNKGIKVFKSKKIDYQFRLEREGL